MTNGILTHVISGFNNTLKQDKDPKLTDYFKMKLSMYFGKLDLINALQVTFGIQDPLLTTPLPFASTFLF